MWFYVIKRKSDDLIFCGETLKWVKKTTDSAHYFSFQDALAASRNTSKTDIAEIVKIDIRKYAGEYFETDFESDVSLSHLLDRYIK